jgi:hypothetical protein
MPFGSAEMVGVGAPICRAVAAEYIRHLQLGTHRVGLGRRRDGDGQRGRLQEVQGTCGGAHLAGREAQIAGGSAQAAMSEQQLDGAHISAGFQQVHGKGMTQGVRRDRFADGGLLADLSAHDLNCAGRDRLSGYIAGEQPMLGPCFTPVGPEDVQELGREHDVTVLALFACRDADRHALAVDCLRRQADGFGDPQASRIAFPPFFSLGAHFKGRPLTACCRHRQPGLRSRHALLTAAVPTQTDSGKGDQPPIA